MDTGSFRVRVLKTGLSLKDALVEEARETARLWVLLGERRVRGGPWCRSRLSSADKAEIAAAVAACASRQAVRDLAASLPSGSLSCHLADAPFPGLQEKPSPAAAKVVLPMRHTSRKPSRSGRSGRSGASGHRYRQQAGITYGSRRYEASKYGKNPKATRNKAQAKYRSKRRGTA